jgi:hypothetical protein
MEIMVFHISVCHIEFMLCQSNDLFQPFEGSGDGREMHVAREEFRMVDKQFVNFRDVVFGDQIAECSGRKVKRRRGRWESSESCHCRGFE